ncbi:MAG: hypothetical protein NC218_00115 [Acetobacter sp.]|nr:hypothetical protein [Acetobacter sp.]
MPIYFFLASFYLENNQTKNTDMFKRISALVAVVAVALGAQAQNLENSLSTLNGEAASVYFTTNPNDTIVASREVKFNNNAIEYRAVVERRAYLANNKVSFETIVSGENLTPEMKSIISRMELPFTEVSVRKGAPAPALEAEPVADLAGLQRTALEAQASLAVFSKDRGPQDTHWGEIAVGNDTIIIPTTTQDKNGLRVGPKAGASYQNEKVGIIAGAEAQYNGNRFMVSVGGQWGQTSYADGQRYNTVATEALAFYKLMSFGKWDTRRLWVGGGVRYTWEKTKLSDILNEEGEAVGYVSSKGNYFSPVAKAIFEVRPHQGFGALQFWGLVNFGGSVRHNESNVHRLGVEAGVTLLFNTFGKTTISKVN